MALKVVQEALLFNNPLRPQVDKSSLIEEDQTIHCKKTCVLSTPNTVCCAWSHQY